MTQAEEWISATDDPAEPMTSDVDDLDQFPTLPLAVLPPALPAHSAPRPLPSIAAILDLGSKNCGDGPLEEVARALHRVPTGAGLEVRTTDGDVAVALLVWCRLVGHDLVERNGGRFFILPVPPRAPRLPQMRE